MYLTADFSKLAVAGSNWLEIYCWNGTKYILKYQLPIPAFTVYDIKAVSLSIDGDYVIFGGTVKSAGGFECNGGGTFSENPFLLVLKYSPEKDIYEKVSQLSIEMLGAWNFRDRDRVDIMSKTAYNGFVDYEMSGNYQKISF